MVADGGSRDATAALAEQAGAEVVRAGRRGGKGAAMTRGGRVGCDRPRGARRTTVRPLRRRPGRLRALGWRRWPRPSRRAAATWPWPRSHAGRAAGSASPCGFARWAIREPDGLRDRALRSRASAPCGRLLRAPRCRSPPASGWRSAMTVDAVRAGRRVEEVELDLEHRATGRTCAASLHRGRQLAAFVARLRCRRRLRRTAAVPDSVHASG